MTTSPTPGLTVFIARRDVTCGECGKALGRLAANICNRGRSGRGCQLETSSGLRLTLFEGLKRRQRKQRTPRFHQFVTAIRTVLLDQ